MDGFVLQTNVSLKHMEGSFCLVCNINLLCCKNYIAGIMKCNEVNSVIYNIINIL